MPEAAGRGEGETEDDGKLTWASKKLVAIGATADIPTRHALARNDAIDPTRTQRRDFAALHGRQVAPNLLKLILILAPQRKLMRRREFITLLGGAAAAWPLVARAQVAGRTYRLGMLSPFPRDHPWNLVFLDELRRRGFIEGQNLTIDYRDFGPHADLISEYAAELVKAQVDLILGGGGTATRAAQQATKTIPILGVAEDMVVEGLVNSMGRPNGNTTGISILATELNGKRFEILIELVPGLHRVGALSDSNTTTDSKIHELQEVARAHKHRAFYLSGRQRRRNPSSHRRGAGIWRHSAQRIGVTDALRQSSAYYGSGSSAAPAGHL
jgi:hypothetical protein